MQQAIDGNKWIFMNRFGNPSTIPTTIVPCPVCRAEQYHCCVGANGKTSNISHRARVKLYQAAIKGQKYGER